MCEEFPHFYIAMLSNYQVMIVFKITFQEHFAVK